MGGTLLPFLHTIILSILLLHSYSLVEGITPHDAIVIDGSLSEWDLPSERTATSAGNSLTLLLLLSIFYLLEIIGGVGCYYYNAHNNYRFV